MLETLFGLNDLVAVAIIIAIICGVLYLFGRR